jgi:RimJ/RimL family protein N-acetyltransferase
MDPQSDVPDQVSFGGLLLRRYEDADVAHFVAAVRESVGTVGRWMSWCHDGYRGEDAVEWFERCRDDRASGTAHEFGVFDVAGALVGGAGLNVISAAHRFCNLGYWVRESRQRERIASRCVQALLPVAFGPLGLRRVEIVVAVGNRASEGVARKAGARFECVARNRIVIDEQSYPAMMFSLVPEDAAR